ncbi:MAG: TrkH family potassium uptake protein [Thermodesulfobacteriota bacterium]
MKFRKRTPIQILSVGFILISLIGGILLYLPISSSSGETTPYLDALFTATSAITTTGLIVVDTGSHYNLFGQIVIMILFQIGGLGYMLFFVFFVLLMGNKLSMQSTLLLHEVVKRPFKIEAAKFAKLIIFYTFVIELIGAIALSIYLSSDFTLPQAVYSAIFHSVSAFNTAGFSIYADNLCRYNNSIVLNIILILIFTAGCLGFWVVFDSFENIRNKLKKKKPSRLSVHSKLVYLLMIVFFIMGTFIIYFSEHWVATISVKEKMLNSIFQTLTATSTTGFNTIDIGGMSEGSLFLIIGFMFIGAGSGSTAGGIKITTFGILLALLYSVLRQKNDVNIFKRRVSAEVIRHSLSIMLLAGLWMFLATLVLSVTESGSFIQILFEVVSALGTVGLSTGITGNLTFIGKLFIIATMLIGRIGPLGVGLSVLKRHRETYKYPLGDIYVG